MDFSHSQHYRHWQLDSFGYSTRRGARTTAPRRASRSRRGDGTSSACTPRRSCRWPAPDRDLQSPCAQGFFGCKIPPGLGTRGISSITSKMTSRRVSPRSRKIHGRSREVHPAIIGRPEVHAGSEVEEAPLRALETDAPLREGPVVMDHRRKVVGTLPSPPRQLPRGTSLINAKIARRPRGAPPARLVSPRWGGIAGAGERDPASSNPDKA